MDKLIIDDSKLIKMNLDYEQIEDYEGNILLNGKLQINRPNSENEQDVIKVYIEFRKENEEAPFFTLTYRFIVHFTEKLSKDEEENILKKYAESQAYSQVQHFLNQFYKIASIEFIDIPSID